MHRVTLLVASFAFGCDGPTREACDLQSPVRSVRQELQSECREVIPELDTDPNSPDFGVASCSVIDGQHVTEHPEFCACENEGYQPLQADEYQAAADRARQDGFCDDDCCRNLCFCELRQLTNDDLRACQQEGVRGSRNGWCYVAPEHGVGTLQVLKQNGPNQVFCDDPQTFVFTGDYLDGVRFPTCWR